MFFDLQLAKFLSALCIFIIALAAGFYPFFKRWRHNVVELPIGEALASGVFLGAGLINLLREANASFINMHYTYPLAFVIAGFTYLIFLALEHFGREYFSCQSSNANGFAFIAFVMLSIHSFFAGSALGLNQHIAVVLILFLVIIAHKWAASFALATKINQASMPKSYALLMFLVFVLMTPLGICFGDILLTQVTTNKLVVPIFNAIAAGTFIYLGTLHGLSRSFMVDKCCNLKHFSFVVIGFALIAAASAWI